MCQILEKITLSQIKWTCKVNHWLRLKALLFLSLKFLFLGSFGLGLTKEAISHDRLKMTKVPNFVRWPTKFKYVNSVVGLNRSKNDHYLTTFDTFWYHWPFEKVFVSHNKWICWPDWIKIGTEYWKNVKFFPNNCFQLNSSTKPNDVNLPENDLTYMAIIESDPIVERNNWICWKISKCKNTLSTVWKLQEYKILKLFYLFTFWLL